MHLVKTKFITEDLIILAWEMEVARVPAPTQVAPDACVNVTECLPLEWAPHQTQCPLSLQYTVG